MKLQLVLIGWIKNIDNKKKMPYNILLPILFPRFVSTRYLYLYFNYLLIRLIIGNIYIINKILICHMYDHFQILFFIDELSNIPLHDIYKK